MSKKTTYEEVIESLELARRLSLGPNYTSAEEKKINPNDGLIIKALKEKYQNITDEDEWVKFGARMITTAQKELRVVKDKLSGKIPLTALETNQSLQTWKAELEQILADSNQATIRKLIMLSAGGKKEITTVAPEVLKENEREELSRLRKENKEFLDKIRNLPPSDKEIISFADALDKLEKVARKLIPPMVDASTQTELTYHDINRMEASEKMLLKFLAIDAPTNPIKDEDRKKDCLFRMEIVARGIAGIQEDMEHSRTRGQEMKRQLEQLEQEIKTGKFTEAELNSKISDLEQLVKRKESDFQKSLKIKEEDWDILEKELKEKLATKGEETERTKKEKQDLEKEFLEFKNACKDRDEELRICQEDKAKIETQRKVFAIMFRSLRKKLKDMETQGITKEQVQKYLEEISEYKKKSNEQTYLLNQLQFYRQMEVITLHSSYFLDGEDRWDFLKDHTCKKPLKIYITYEYFFKYDEGLSGYKIFEDVGKPYSFSDLLNKRNQWYQYWNKYTSNMNKTYTDTTDYSFLYTKYGLQPLSFAFIHNSFYYGDNYHRYNFDKIPETIGDADIDLKTISQRAVKNIVFPVYVEEQQGIITRNSAPMRIIQNKSDLWTNEIYLPQHLHRRPGDIRREVELVFNNESSLNEATRQNQSDYNNRHWHWVERSNYFKSYGRNYLQSLVAYTSFNTGSSINLQLLSTISNETPSIWSVPNSSFRVPHITSIKKGTISVQIIPPTQRPF